MAPPAGLPQVVALFQLRTTDTIPGGGGEWRSLEILDLAEVAALAVTLRMYGRRSGAQADRSTTHKATLVIVSKEDRYDRTL